MVPKVRPNRKVFCLRAYYKFTSFWAFSGRPLKLRHNLKLVLPEWSMLLFKHKWTCNWPRNFNFGPI